MREVKARTSFGGEIAATSSFEAIVRASARNSVRSRRETLLRGALRAHLRTREKALGGVNVLATMMVGFASTAGASLARHVAVAARLSSRDALWVTCARGRSGGGRLRVPLARASAPPAQPEGGRRSKSGPSSSYIETWDGKYDMETQGMWDTRGVEGPSCYVLPPLERATREELEKVYEQAKNTYFSGQPVIEDRMFDEVERRLRHMGSDAARKYPRCSRRDMKIYGDLQADDEQMRALENIWHGFAVVGIGFIVVDVAELARVFLDPSNAHDTGFRLPALAVLGAFLFQSARNKVKALERGDVVAVAGDCPSCGERVYIFLPGNEGSRVTRGSECHVCERSVSFRADVRVDTSSKWRRGATGRVYLATRADDYYDDSAEDENDDAEWPPRAKNAENAR